MKKTLPIIAVLIILLTLCACGESSSDGDAAMNTPTPVVYEKEDGRLIQEVNYNANGLKYLTVFYDYDGQSRVTKEMRMGVNNAPEGYYTNEYDGNGRLSLRVSYAALGPDEYAEEYRVSYEYDDKGLLVSEKRSAEGVLLSVTDYEYNEDSLLTGEKLYQGDSFLAAEYKYGYDGSGRRISCQRSDYMENATMENRYTYDGNDLLVTDLICDSEGNVRERVDYTYDNSGNVLKRSVFGDKGVLQSYVEYEYTYDEAGNIVKSVCSDSEGNVTITTEYTWTYSKG
ncbi:MAG: hypothetical protein HUJ66_00910 [Oscillospiraceae bacterium]|nr:hypothetical protein [Oscillospiraceae bacterium]